MCIRDRLPTIHEDRQLDMNTPRGANDQLDTNTPLSTNGQRTRNALQNPISKPSRPGFASGSHARARHEPRNRSGLSSPR
eukprot:14397839-Alexandrium_andersonii.AAC.1